MTQKIWLLIPAAGSGQRFGTKLAKQYQPLLNSTVLEQTLSCFKDREDIAGIVVAISATDTHFQSLNLPSSIVSVIGGKTRLDSVLAALNYLNDIASDSDLVAVHDAARPCVDQSSIDAVFTQAQSAANGCLLALPLVDTLKQAIDYRVMNTPNREEFFCAQTPQVFTVELLTKALHHAKANALAITDDAAAVEALGLKPQLVIGNTKNIKITHTNDLSLAAFYLSQKTEVGD